jgi:predicted metal-dependent peptidase
MPTIQISLPNASKLTDEQKDMLAKDLVTNPVRKLTKEERDIYGGAVINAVRMMPAFRDAVGLLNPYLDATSPTAYTDRYARMGLSYWFLYVLNPYQRGSVLLHEAMHVLNNHFARGEAAGINPTLMNTAGDFEINTTLERARGVDLSSGIFPNKGKYNFPTGLSMEQYAILLKDMDDPQDDISGPDANSAPDPNGQSQPGQDPGDGSGEGSGDGEGGDPSDSEGSGSGSGSGKVTDADNEKSWGCSNNSEKREKAADEAGVERSSAVEQNSVKANTAARISDEITKSRQAGDGHMEEFYRIVLEKITPPRVDWRQIFKRVLASANDAVIRGRSDYSYKKVSRRLSGGDYIFPGMVKYVPNAMLGVDISGSMTQDDYQRTLTEAEGIMKNAAKSKGGMKVFSVDTQVSNIQLVNSVRELNLYGGGGTRMDIAVDYINSLSAKDRPDVFVLATDGGTDWSAFERSTIKLGKKCKMVVLVTSKYGWDSVTDSLKRLTTMIDVSKD